MIASEGGCGSDDLCRVLEVRERCDSTSPDCLNVFIGMRLWRSELADALARSIEHGLERLQF